MNRIERNGNLFETNRIVPVCHTTNFVFAVAFVLSSEVCVSCVDVFVLTELTQICVFFRAYFIY